MSRTIQARYVDPLSQLWLGCAQAMGLRVERSGDAYASTDGKGVLVIADDGALDADDSLGQMIFHELCHSLIEGPNSFERADWGMDNETDDDHWREHACLRLQRVLTARYGLEGLFAPTTEFRTFWDSMGDPLADRQDRSVIAAIKGLARIEDPPWASGFTTALASTAKIAAELRVLPLVEGTLWQQVEPPTPHPTGLPAAPGAGTCGDCAWHYTGGPGPRAERCRQAEGARVDPTWSRCERYEAALDCLTCGACCREAYGGVEVARTERVIKRHPALVVDRGTYVELRRVDGDGGTRCAALVGSVIEDGRLTTTACTIYKDRPKTCRDFALGSENCLTARRRVGLSL